VLTESPREKEWVSWFYVVLWSLVIFVTIPFARPIQIFVSNNWGRDLFGYLVIAITVIIFGVTAINLLRFRKPSRSGYVWLLLISVIVIYYTVRLMAAAPEEALHFVQYGFLGILIFRALSHRSRDVSIYFVAAVIGGIIGIIDETIQWATPRRYWALGDIWLNFFGTLLSQVAIAKGLRPLSISGTPSRRGLLLFCRLFALALVLLGLSFSNTPTRISWYSERISFLEFLKTNESVMLEYGYLYKDPDFGRFRSRLSPEELSRIDLERGVEAAMVLDQFREDSAYGRFLELYTPVNDPFLHEARVHLFRRDRYMANSLLVVNDEEEYRRYLSIAYCENQIMEKYFPNTLYKSGYVLSTEQSAYLSERFSPEDEYDSAVSWQLITRITEIQLQIVLIFLLTVVGAVYRYYRKNEVAGTPP
jgi:VanZ family protein